MVGSVRSGVRLVGLVSVLTIGGVLALPTPAGAERTPATESASPLRDAIVFTRFLPDVEMGVVYRLDAGETLVRPIHSVFDAAILSPDGSRFLDFGPTPYGRGSTGIFNIDGSGYHVLPLRDPTLELPGGKWTSGGNRIASEGFSNAGVTNGIYSRRSSDGGGLLRLTDAGTRNDYPAKASPDGSELLFFRPDAPHETSDSAAQDLFVVASRTGPTIRLTPKSVTTGIVFSDDSVSWSPDSRRVAVTAARGDFWSNTRRSVYIASADGSGFAPIGPRGDIWDAMWSPDGRWIAFTMATAGLHELFLMHPTGSSVRQLTFSAGGLDARQPTWSPDSSQLLFSRGRGDPHESNLWSIDVDGSHLFQVTHRLANYSALAWLR
jgi:WD40-like Beta Propeller Repeat